MTTTNLAHTTVLNTALTLLATEIKQEKEIEGGKKESDSLADDVRYKLKHTDQLHFYTSAINTRITQN